MSRRHDRSSCAARETTYGVQSRRRSEYRGRSSRRNCSPGCELLSQRLPGAHCFNRGGPWPPALPLPPAAECSRAVPSRDRSWPRSPAKPPVIITIVRSRLPWPNGRSGSMRPRRGTALRTARWPRSSCLSLTDRSNRWTGMLVSIRGAGLGTWCSAIGARSPRCWSRMRHRRQSQSWRRSTRPRRSRRCRPDASSVLSSLISIVSMSFG